jgi:hypothetical protein
LVTATSNCRYPGLWATSAGGTSGDLHDSATATGDEVEPACPLGCSGDCLSVHPATVSVIAAARSEIRIARVDSPFMFDFLSAQFTKPRVES